MADLLKESKPRTSGNKSDESRKHAWSAREAAAFLDAAKKGSPQSAAFYAMALDTGMRKGELGGLRWANVDLDAGKVQVVEQLQKTGPEPEWGPTKTGKPRVIDIDRDIVILLRERLGHSKVSMTTEVHAHVLPGDQAEAAATLGAFLHR